MPALERPSGHEREHLSLTRAEHRQRVVTVAGSDQLGD